jgi:hypothetical protein
MLASAVAADAQTLRTLESSRQIHDSAAVDVHIRYGSGRLGLRSTGQPLLYQMELRYDPAQAQPLHTFQTAARRLDLGVRSQAFGFGGSKNAGSMRVELAQRVPMSLSLELGAVEADLDLSGLALHALNVRSGASETSIRFDSVNARPLQRIDVEVGAASLRALRLANSGAREIHVQAGVGSVDLDFDGLWRHDVRLDVQVALGGVTIHVPRNVGVELELDKVLMTFDDEGLIKRDGRYVSDNWETATYKLRIKASTVFGKLVLDRR